MSDRLYTALTFLVVYSLTAFALYVLAWVD